MTWKHRYCYIVLYVIIMILTLVDYFSNQHAFVEHIIHTNVGNYYFIAFVLFLLTSTIHMHVRVQWLLKLEGIHYLEKCIDNLIFTLVRKLSSFSLRSILLFLNSDNRSRKTDGRRRTYPGCVGMITNRLLLSIAMPYSVIIVLNGANFESRVYTVTWFV